MPTNRFQFSDDFVLNANKVGINTATPQEKLDVVGIVKGDNLKVTGVSSFTSYEGFLNSNHNITENTTLTSGTSGSLSGEIIVGTDITLSGISSTTSGQGHIDSLKVYNTLTIPVGGTLERPSKSKPGQLYYNKDFSTIEFYTGEVWRQVDNTTQRGRGVFGGGDTPTYVATIDTVTISSTGNAVDFGTLILGRANAGAVASSIRGVWAGGESVPAAAQSNVIDYVTIASAGNAIDFGDLLTASRYRSGCGSSTRGLFGWGSTPGTSNVIEYITINTLGYSLDFGDLLTAAVNNGACSSSTRGVFADSQLSSNSIQFVTIASLGNASYFGELTNTTNYDANRCCSNSIRGINVGGGSVPLISNVIDYITIATTGNAIRFGDLTVARVATSACASQTRGVFAGGHVNPLQQNLIDYVTIATTGKAQDFGDLTSARRETGAVSDSHGGLGGF